jgi:hypothetical protein
MSAQNNSKFDANSSSKKTGLMNRDWNFMIYYEASVRKKTSASEPEITMNVWLKISISFQNFLYLKLDPVENITLFKKNYFQNLTQLKISISFQKF